MVVSNGKPPAKLAALGRWMALATVGWIPRKNVVSGTARALAQPGT